MRLLPVILVLAVAGVSGETPRRIPGALPDHPGNVFLAGESVSVRVPADLRAKTTAWLAEDVDGKRIGGGEGEACDLGILPVGWYRISFQDGTAAEIGWTSVGVIARPKAPVPLASPVCVDSATSWFARNDAQRRREFAYLASLAGVNWIRDRMNWGAIETARGTYAPPGTAYDDSASALSGAGLQVLQVFHATPRWALDKRLDGEDAGHRFPRDLRELHRFIGAAAVRFKGRIGAWEPWNEANISNFGGHTIDEMCALQKAAYLGVRAVDPAITVCWNVYAGSGSPLHTEGVLRNETWPYFDTFNIHSYSTTEKYLSEFGTALEAACGRPIWITECGIRLPAATERPWAELKPQDAIRQAEFLPKSFASSLFAGVSHHFFFILGNFWERGTQFGLLRHDQTPRPGFLALAATGRFLAGAECLGRVRGESGGEMVVFRASPDGEAKCVIIAWAEKATGLGLPSGIRPEACYDCFGRPAAPALGPRPMFLILPLEAAGRLALEPPRHVSRLRSGTASALVIQAEFSHGATVLQNQAHRVALGKDVAIPLWIYNFGNAQAAGVITATAPEGWTARLPRENLSIAPGERHRIELVAQLPASGRGGLRGDWITVRGEFGGAGRPVCAFRLCGDVRDLTAAAVRDIASATNGVAWVKNVVGGARMTAEGRPDGAVVFTMDFGGSDPWAYPYINLAKAEIPGEGFDGLEATLQLLEGEGTLRAQFVEESGASYVSEFDAARENRQPQRLIAFFNTAKWGSHSKPDPSGALELANIRRLMIGINSRQNSRVKLLVRDLRWVKF